MATPEGYLPVPGTADAMLGDLLWEVAGQVEMMGEAALAGLPVTTASSGMLTLVLARPGITVTEIARQFSKAQQTISQMAARLESLRLIERRVGSGRSVGLFLTQAGRDLAGQAIARERQVDAHVRELLGSDRYAQAREVLIDCRERLRTRREADAPPRDQGPRR